MAARLKEKILAEKMKGLAAAKEWSPRVIEKLMTLIREADGEALFRINPIRFAADRGMIEHEAVDLFLHATHLAMFQLEWGLVCPTCGDAVESFRALDKLNAHFHCSICNLNGEASLDDFIQVSFTISPELREISYHHPEALSVEDFHFKYHFNQSAVMPDGPRFIDAAASLVKGLSYLAPGQRKRFEVEMQAGTLAFNDLMHHASGEVSVRAASGATAPGAAAPGAALPAKGAPEVVRVRLEGGTVVPESASVSAGKVQFVVENNTAGKASMMILGFPPGFVKKPLRFEPFLSGKKLLTFQTFRNLFSSEVIQGSEGIGVRDITILFTDLKGSTALYERIGDLKAFSLVHQHFERLGRVINQSSGALVKTIGDAVMATFLNPLDAVKAALEMNKEIGRFNRGLANRDVILKIGIHKGPCIAVTLNDRQDYFGQTVNTASRVQGLAGAEEIYVTNEVFGFPGVKGLLKGCKVFAGKVKLKGMREETQVYKISLAPAVTETNGTPSGLGLKASAAAGDGKRAP
jgi:class 3 adenylate cyclase